MSIQEEHYAQDYDYWSGSPHLKHRHLHETLMGRVAGELERAASGRSARVLEVGAGDGAITERLLALGCEVVGSDMSADSVGRLRTKFGTNDRFRAIHDPDGMLEPLGGERFDATMYPSVLHHIPDYLGHLETIVGRHLEPGGSLITVQDPLWYSRLPATTMKLTRAAYLSWRLGQGEFMRGLRTRTRRLRSGLSETEPGDAVEYHVVRDGVDEEAIARFTASCFAETEVFKYWSSQGGPQQKAGERMGLVNTFAIFASDFRTRDK